MSTGHVAGGIGSGVLNPSGRSTALTRTRGRAGSAAAVVGLVVALAGLPGSASAQKCSTPLTVEHTWESIGATAAPAGLAPAKFNTNFEYYDSPLGGGRVTTQIFAFPSKVTTLPGPFFAAAELDFAVTNNTGQPMYNTVRAATASQRTRVLGQFFGWI